MNLEKEISRRTRREADYDDGTGYDDSSIQDEISLPTLQLPSVALNNSSWSKLQISPVEFGSMPYSHYGLNIYQHSENSLQPDESKRRYYYIPICEMNHRSAVSSYNNVTRKREVNFRIEMWNEALEKKVLDYTSMLAGHSLKPEQIRVLPLEKILLSSSTPPDNYELPNVWHDYQRHQFLWFSLVCPRSSSVSDCDELANEMRTNPNQFNHLRLLFSLSSQTSRQQDTVIRIENIMAGELMGRINQRYPDTGEVDYFNLFINENQFQTTFD